MVIWSFSAAFQSHLLAILLSLRGLLQQGPAYRMTRVRTCQINYQTYFQELRFWEVIFLLTSGLYIIRVIKDPDYVNNDFWLSQGQSLAYGFGDV